MAPPAAHAVEFSAAGPTTETKLDPDKFLGAVNVSFDLAPNTSMSFDLPWHFCMVSENGIKFANFAAETYDPRNWNGTGADASFEPGMDKRGDFCRVWIEQRSAARIVVRVRYALNNSKYAIAHDDLFTGSPYNGGKGDWGEEWFTIYPDSTYVRHMRIHTGLASMSQPFGFFREPPQVIHEFMESIVIGPPGHVPTQDINTNPALYLYKMFGSHPGTVYAKGQMGQIAYQLPAGPPNDYGDFRDANIMLINSKSQYKPFTIGLPYGVKVQPYGWEGSNHTYPFTFWTGYREPSIAYISPIGHMVNFWHYRRTIDTIEQVYLQGLTNSANPQSDLLKLAWSWIAAPELQMPDARISPNDSAGKYNLFTYDQTQKAYIVPRSGTGAATINFVLAAIYNDAYLRGTMWLVNPAIIVKNWNAATGVTLKVNRAIVKATDYRVGYEKTGRGTDLVIWLKKTYNLTTATDNKISVSISPAVSPNHPPAATIHRS